MPQQLNPKENRYDRVEIIEHLASQYVLGTLSINVRMRVEKLMQSNKKLSRSIEHWQDKLINLDHETNNLTPKPETWQAIMHSVEQAQEKCSIKERQTVEDIFEQNGSVNTTNKARLKSSFWEKINTTLDRLLRFSTYRYANAMSMIVLTLSVIFVLPKIQDQDPLSYVAVLTEDSGQAHIVASTYGHSQKLILNVINIPDLDTEESFELWVVSKTDQQARSLGILPINQPLIQQQLTDAQWRLIKDSQSLFISKEELGGSAIGEPSDRIVSRGLCVRLQQWNKNA